MHSGKNNLKLSCIKNNLYIFFLEYAKAAILNLLFFYEMIDKAFGFGKFWTNILQTIAHRTITSSFEGQRPRLASYDSIGRYQLRLESCLFKMFRSAF